MSESKNWASGSLINSGWLNAVDATVFEALGDGALNPPTTPAQVRTNLGVLSSAQLAASSGSSLVGFIQSGTGAVARMVQDKARESVSVLDFGADPTGVADSTTAIQNAIASLTNGGNVFLPKGTYKFSGLTFPDIGSIELRGEGKYATVLSYTGSGTAITKANQAAAKSAYLIKGLSIVNTGTGTIGIDLTACWQSKVDNNLISGFTTGIYLSRGTVGTYWNRISRNEIIGSTSGIVLSATGSAGQVNQNWIHNNRIYNATTVGIKIEATQCVMNTVIENDIESTGALARFIDCQGDKNFISRNWLDSVNAANVGLYLRGTRNIAEGNIYAGTFATPAYDLSTNANQFYEPDRTVSFNNLTSNSFAGNVGVGTAYLNAVPTYPLDVKATPVSGVLAKIAPDGDLNNVCILQGGNGATERTAALDFYNNTTRRWSIQKDNSAGNLIVVDAVGGGTVLSFATGSKIGFYNATPVAQQLFATGTGKTVDQLITVLQTLGLLRQT